MGKINRILYVHNSADFYGASRSLLRTIERLNREVYDPVVVLPQEGPLAEAIRKHNVKVYFLPEMSIISRYYDTFEKKKQFFLSIPKSVGKLRKIIREEKIDLVHTNTAVILSGALAAFFSNVHHVWHVREFFSEFKFRWIFYRPFMLTLSDRIIAVSGAAGRQYGRSDKVAVIHNGVELEELGKKGRIDVIHDGFDMKQFEVDREELGQNFRKEHNIASEMFVVGCVGRIKFQRKGQDVFVRALALLKKKGVSFFGLIVGAPYAANEGEWDRLRQLMKELDLTEKEILLTGEIKDTRPAYAAMDVSTLPSATPEPFGGVVLESMGMILPVIATNIGGSPEQVDDGVTGFLVPPNDPEALAEKIDVLRRDPALRSKMGHAGHEKLKNSFALDRNVELVQQLYAAILSS